MDIFDDTPRPVVLFSFYDLYPIVFSLLAYVSMFYLLFSFIGI